MPLANDYQLRIERWETPRNFTNYEDYIKFRRANMLTPLRTENFSALHNNYTNNINDNLNNNIINEEGEKEQLSRTSSATLSISASLSQSQLVGVSTRNAFYKKHNTLERRLIIGVAALVVLLVILLGSLAAVVYYHLYCQRTVCSSRECIESAANFLQAMDETVDPCDDFYKFSCGRWGDAHPIPDSAMSHDWFIEKQADMMRTIRDFLQKNNTSSDPVPVVQARSLYSGCMDLARLEDLGLAPMFTLLDQLGLSRSPVGGVASTWVRTVTSVKTLLSKEVLVGVGVFSDVTNKSVNHINIGAPDSKSPMPSGTKDLDRHIERRRRRDASSVDADTAEGRAYVKYMADVMTYIAAPSNVNYTAAATRVDYFEKRLLKAIEAAYTSDEVLEMSVDQLQRATFPVDSTPVKWSWLSYFQLLFANYSVDAITDDEVIVVRNFDYLVVLGRLLQETDEETVGLYIWWDIAKNLAPQTVRYLRDLRHNYIQQVSGDEMAPLTRSMFCAGAVNQMMGLAASLAIVRPEFVNTTRVKVKEMLSDIRSAFEELVHAADWMDHATKMATMEKAKLMASYIGFPDWLLVEGEIEKEYEGIDVCPDTYLMNMATILRKSVADNFVFLRRENRANSTDSWITVPTDVNAYYTFQSNSINVPIAILQSPFYGLGLEALNYGAIGSILGHELTHGYDNTGRQYDKNGRLRQWWSNQTVEEYEERTSCFIHQYSQYKLEHLNQTVDGSMTLGENIADNGGLREALGAYRNYVKRHGEEPQLPGLEQYSHEQLFYLAFGNIWCSAWTLPSLPWMLRDEHSPNPIRVRGVLSNSQDFADVWKCKPGSRMNDNTARCRLW